jgi:phage terminase small subunit
MNLPVPIPATDSGKELTAMQAAFVDAFVSNGGHREDAAIEAGYSRSTARQQAYELLAKPHVMQAIMARTMNELISHAPSAVQRLHQLLSAKSEYVALQASQDLLNRVGLKVAERVDHRIAGDIQVNIDLGGGG